MLVGNSLKPLILLQPHHNNKLYKELSFPAKVITIKLIKSIKQHSENISECM